MGDRKRARHPRPPSGIHPREVAVIPGSRSRARNWRVLRTRSRGIQRRPTMSTDSQSTAAAKQPATRVRYEATARGQGEPKWTTRDRDGHRARDNRRAGPRARGGGWSARRASVRAAIGLEARISSLRSCTSWLSGLMARIHDDEHGREQEDEIAREIGHAPGPRAQRITPSVVMERGSGAGDGPCCRCWRQVPGPSDCFRVRRRSARSCRGPRAGRPARPRSCRGRAPGRGPGAPARGWPLRTRPRPRPPCPRSRAGRRGSPRCACRPSRRCRSGATNRRSVRPCWARRRIISLTWATVSTSRPLSGSSSTSTSGSWSSAEIQQTFCFVPLERTPIGLSLSASRPKRAAPRPCGRGCAPSESR